MALASDEFPKLISIPEMISLESVQQQIWQPELKPAERNQLLRNDQGILLEAKSDPTMVIKILTSIRYRERLNILQQTGLQFASGFLKTIEVLLGLIEKKDRGDVLSTKTHGVSLLHLSNAEHCALILQTVDYEELLNLINIRDHLDQTVLEQAVLNSDQKKAETLLSLLDEPDLFNVIGKQGENGETILHRAASNRKNLHILLTALASKSQTKLKHLLMVHDKHGNTVYVKAMAVRDSLQLLLEILSSGEVFALLGQNSDLDDAIWDQLLQGSSRLDEMGMEKIRNTYYLHKLAKENNYEMIRLLMRKLTDKHRYQLLSQMDQIGKTPYHIAGATKVKTLLSWAESQKGFYYLSTPPVVLIMYSTVDREGAEDELRSLKRVLPGFTVKTVTKKDLTKSEMMSAIRDVQHEGLSALIVIIMTHGQKGAVHAKDGPVNINELLLQMTPAFLDGKPKVLLVQACQVQAKGTVRLRESNNQLQVTTIGTQTDQRDAKGKLSAVDHFDIKHPDLIALIAAVNGGEALRNHMIPLFAHNLSHCGKDEDLYMVFLKTHFDISEETPQQVPEFRSTLRKKLCLRNIFNPTIFNPTIVQSE